jgi:hypothetical protein
MSQIPPDHLLNRHEGDRALLTPEELARVAVLEKQEFVQRDECYRTLFGAGKGTARPLQKATVDLGVERDKSGGGSAGDDLAERAWSGADVRAELKFGGSSPPIHEPGRHGPTERCP